MAGEPVLAAATAEGPIARRSPARAPSSASGRGSHSVPQKPPQVWTAGNRIGLLPRNHRARLGRQPAARYGRAPFRVPPFGGGLPRSAVETDSLGCRTRHPSDTASHPRPREKGLVDQDWGSGLAAKVASRCRSRIAAPGSGAGWERQEQVAATLGGAAVR
jgi:hypothetical protein